MAEDATSTLERKRSWLQIIVIGRNPTVTMVRIVVTAVVIVLMAKFVLLPIRVQGGSMMPTYKDGQINLVNRLAYTAHEPRRGDVVAIRMAGTHVMLMKRVVGLPGEAVSFANGQLLINGRPISEPYLKLPCNWTHAPEQVGANEFYVVGDNRSMGFEEHTRGRADRKKIVGKVFL